MKRIFFLGLLALMALIPSVAEAQELTWDLQSLYREYVKGDAEIQEKRYLDLSAQSTARATESGLYPKFSLASSLNISQGGGFSTFLSTISTPFVSQLNAVIYQSSIGVNVSYMLFDNGSRGAQVRKDLSLSEVFSLDEKQVREEKLFNLASNYFSLAELRIKRKTLEEVYATYQRLERIVKLKTQQGKYLDLDYRQFQLKGEELRLGLDNNQREMEFITTQLDDFLKNNQKNTYDTSLMEYWLEYFQALDLPEVKSESSAQYRKGDATLRARESEMVTADSTLWPTLSLSGNYSYQRGALAFGDVFNNLSNAWSGILNLDWVLWDDQERENRRKAQEFQVLAARSSLAKAKDLVDLNLKSIRKDHENQKNNLLYLEKGLAIAENSRKIQQLRYDSGLLREEQLLSGITSAKDAREKVMDSRLQLEVLRAKYLKETSSLEEIIFTPRYFSKEGETP